MTSFLVLFFCSFAGFLCAILNYSRTPMNTMNMNCKSLALWIFRFFVRCFKLSKVYHFQSHIFVFWSVGIRADWEAFLLSPPSGEDYTVSRLMRRLFWSLLLPACYAYVVEYFFATFWGMSMTMWKGISSSFYLYPFCQRCCYWIMFCCNTKLSALSFSW